MKTNIGRSRRRRDNRGEGSNNWAFKPRSSSFGFLSLPRKSTHCLFIHHHSRCPRRRHVHHHHGHHELHHHRPLHYHQYSLYESRIPARRFSRDEAGLELGHGFLLPPEAEDEELVFVMTDEWKEFFAKSEAISRSERKKAKNKGMNSEQV